MSTHANISTPKCPNRRIRPVYSIGKTGDRSKRADGAVVTNRMGEYIGFSKKKNKSGEVVKTHHVLDLNSRPASRSIYIPRKYPEWTYSKKEKTAAHGRKRYTPTVPNKEAFKTRIFKQALGISN
ncbi:hypothetical protein JIN85_14835 [Luteolibacter pohnpeiensis]|uniref:Uncharacterized protein n=1 Tax=Luteolibacter pohnpeiensis TaxID=454153 RepID=A0A934S6S7_9BACT|nr:hypothetical protein [Luteolibacter pohnpeiensis]MBK1883691.1 hypothetical protein [Luteolibacter pohnpeiensis]